MNGVAAAVIVAQSDIRPAAPRTDEWHITRTHAIATRDGFGLAGAAKHRAPARAHEVRRAI